MRARVDRLIVAVADAFNCSGRRRGVVESSSWLSSSLALKTNAMGKLSQDHWDSAVHRCQSRLTEDERRSLGRPASFDLLQDQIACLKDKYQRGVFSKCLGRLEPFLLNLHSLASVVDVFAQAKPEILSLLWGSLRLVLELVSRHSNAIEHITNALASIGESLPRYEFYQTLFPHSNRISSLFAELCEMIVDFGIDTIRLLKKHPFRVIISSLWKNYEQEYRRACQRIKDKSATIDLESHAANMQLEATRHDEIKRLIMNNPTPTAPAVTKALPYHLLPIPENPHFFKQDDALAACRGSLDPGATPSSLRLFSLHGLGGVGKTSIALQYAHASKSTYSVILWLAAESIARLSQALSQAARDLGVATEQTKPDEAREALSNWLRQHDQPWLLVFDNVEDVSVLKGCWPTSGIGSVLVTSRDPESHHTLTHHGFKVTPFSQQDGAAFLLRSLPGVDLDDNTNILLAEQISQKLGGLALGLKQMGSFMRESSCSMQEFLELFRDKSTQQTLFKDDASFTKLGYEHTLATVWDISLSKLSDVALGVLSFFSFLEPDQIPKMIVDGLAAECQTGKMPFLKPTNKVEFLQAVRQLTRYSLIFQGLDGSFSIHRLVQATKILKMTPDARQKYFSAVVQVIWTGHPKSKETSNTLFPHWEKCAKYASHVDNLGSMLPEWGLEPRPLGRFFDIVFESSWYLLETGDMARCEEVSRFAETLCDLSSAQGRIDLSYIYNSYGIIGFQHNNIEESLSWFEKAHQFRVDNLPPTDENIYHAEMNMCFVLRAMRRYEETLKHLEQLVERVSKIPNATLRLRAGVISHKAPVYLALGMLDEAESAMDEAMALAELDPSWSRHSGAGASDYYARGNLYIQRLNLPEALRFHSMALNIKKDIFGDHISTAASFYKVGDIMARMEAFQDAKDLLLEAHRMCGSLKLIGNFSKGGKARAAFRLVAVCRALGDEASAVSFQNEAEDIYRSICVGAPSDNPGQREYESLVNEQDL